MNVCQTGRYLHPPFGNLITHAWIHPLVYYKVYECGAHYFLFYVHKALTPIIRIDDVYVKDWYSAIHGNFSSTVTTPKSTGIGNFSSSDSWTDMIFQDVGTYPYPPPSKKLWPPDIGREAHGEYDKITSFSHEYILYFPELDPYGQGIFGHTGHKAVVAFDIIIKEAEPYNSLLKHTASQEMRYTMPEGDLYLIVQPNGGDVTIKGAINPSNNFIEIAGLPQDTPYRIVNDDRTIAVGMTSSSGKIAVEGTIPDHSSLEGVTQLHLYTDSLVYSGGFGTVILDDLNHNTLRIGTEEDIIYTVHTYAPVQVVGNVTVSNLKLDETLPIPYLDGDYSTGDVINVPIIPGYDAVRLEINGNQTLWQYSHISGGTGIKIADSSRSTFTKLDLFSSIHSAEAVTGTVAYAIAAADGTLKAEITETISGDIEIKNTYKLEKNPPPPPSPPERDPLVGYVDIFVNRKKIDTEKLGTNPNPAFTATSTNSSLTAVRGVTYTYPDYTLSGAVSVPVKAGDHVELYVYAKIYGEIDRYTVPTGYTLQSSYGDSIATAKITSANITTGM